MGRFVIEDTSVVKPQRFVIEENSLQKVVSDKKQKDGHGLRVDGTLKENGYFGVLKTKSGKDMTEYSIGININGKETEIPTLVPTLTEKEKQFLLTEPKDIPKSIIDKAAAHAKKRMAEGLSPFASNSEHKIVMSDTKLEKPETILSHATAPLKRIPDIYNKEVSESIKQIKQPGLLNKIFGSVRYVSSPITAPVEALIGDPVEGQAKRAGASEPVAKFARGMAEGTAYMWSPSKAISSQLPKVPSAVKQIQKAESLRKKTQGLKVMKFIKDRTANIDKATLDSEFFIVKKIENKLSKLEREALPFMRQNINDPTVLNKIGRDDLISVLKNPSTALKQATKEVGKYYDESYEFLKEHGGDVKYIEDYVTQIWDIPKNKRSDVVNYFVTNNPFTKKRKIPTLEEGIKLGLKPKTTDIAEILRIYDQLKIKTAFNLKFANEIKGMTDEVGNSLIQGVNKAPDNWIPFDHPALRKVVYSGKTAKGATILDKSSVKIHPEIAQEMKIIFDSPFSSGAVTAVETINAFTKKAMLSGSFFHHLALTESALSSGVGRKALAMWNPIKIYKALKNKDFDIYKKMPLAKDAIDSGVSFGALSDVQLSKVDRAFRAAEQATKKMPIIGKGVKAARKANDLWDRALWDYYHNNLKLYAYEAQVQKELKRLKPVTSEQISSIKKEVAGFVNDSFGGQQWDDSKFLGNPKMKQIMQWVLLAPDWTISTLKQASAPVTGLVKGNKSQMVTGSKFWARAALYNTIISQSINYTATKKILGEGKFTWENDPGHETHIFAGYNDDGTKKYLRTGKQFREAIEWVIDPAKKLGGKLSPVFMESMRQATGHSPGSMFPADFAEEDFWKSLPKRALSVALTPVPFSLKPYIKKGSPKNFMFTLPASRGMTNYKTVKLFKKAITDKSVKKIKRIYVSALENNLDAMQLFHSAKAAVKADITYEDKNIAIDINNEMKGLDKQAKIDLLGIYKKRGILTENIFKQLNRLNKKQQSIKKQRFILENKEK